MILTVYPVSRLSKILVTADSGALKGAPLHGANPLIQNTKTSRLSALLIYQVKFGTVPEFSQRPSYELHVWEQPGTSKCNLSSAILHERRDDQRR